MQNNVSQPEHKHRCTVCARVYKRSQDLKTRDNLRPQPLINKMLQTFPLQMNVDTNDNIE